MEAKKLLATQSHEHHDDEHLAFDDRNDPDHGAPPSRRRSTALKLVALSAIVISATFFVGRVSHDLIFNEASSPKPVSVGYFPAEWREAKALGRIYDFVLSNWIHPRCHNQQLFEQYIFYLGEMNSTYWLEIKQINQVPLEVAATGEHGDLFTKGKIHHLHCSYILHRIIFASESTLKVLDSYSRRPEHVGHCYVFNGDPVAREDEAEDTFTRLFNLPEGVDCLIG